MNAVTTPCLYIAVTLTDGSIQTSAGCVITGPPAYGDSPSGEPATTTTRPLCCRPAGPAEQAKKPSSLHAAYKLNDPTAWLRPG